jgi:hypothetical protein
MACNTRYYWVSGLCALTGIPKKHNFSETGCFQRVVFIRILGDGQSKKKNSNPFKNRCINAKHSVQLTGSLRILSREFRCVGGWINVSFRKGSTDNRPKLDGDEDSGSNVE